MSDWTDKAREWLLRGPDPLHDLDDEYDRKVLADLAALLREAKIRGEAQVSAEQAGEFHRGYQVALAEVRKIVRETFDPQVSTEQVRREILRRIEGLK